MNQEKIGKFIAKVRKEKNIQKEKKTRSSFIKNGASQRIKAVPGLIKKWGVQIKKWGCPGKNSGTVAQLSQRLLF